MEVASKPTLYKHTATGATQTWSIKVERTPEGFGEIIVTHGQMGGKMQETREVIKEGKNLGKKNATSALEQAVLEATAKWTKQRDRNHYGLSVYESGEKKAVAPMLAQTIEDHKQPIDWTQSFAQPKLDGHRCLAMRSPDGEVQMISRQGKPITTLQHILKSLHELLPKDVILDGELYVHGVPLNTVGSWIKREQPESAKIIYNVYDTVLPVSFAERHAALWRLCRAVSPSRVVKPGLELVETRQVWSPEELHLAQAEYLQAGYEGAMLRHGPAGYESGKRSMSLLKCKTFLDDEFPITAVREGRGTFEGMAILACRTPGGAVFEVTAPGTHEEKRAALANRDSLIGRMLTVKYAYMTSTASPVPFHPVALRFKEDV